MEALAALLSVVPGVAARKQPLPHATSIPQEWRFLRCFCCTFAAHQAHAAAPSSLRHRYPSCCRYPNSTSRLGTPRLKLPLDSCAQRLDHLPSVPESASSFRTPDRLFRRTPNSKTVAASVDVHSHPLQTSSEAARQQLTDLSFANDARAPEHRLALSITATPMRRAHSSKWLPQ